MTPDVKKMREVYEWCRTSPSYNQSTTFFQGGSRCFGGKVLELYCETNPFKLLGLENHDEIAKILGITQQEATSKFIHKKLSLSDIDKNIKYYEDQLKPKHNFKVNDYVVVVAQGNVNGRRGKVVDITRMDVFVEFHHGPKHRMEFKPQEIMLEDKSTQLLRKLYRTLSPGTDESEDIGNFLYDLDKQGK